MPVHGGKLAARALKKAGVECIFTLSRRPHHADLRRLPRRGHQASSTCATSRPPCTPPTRGRAATRARSASRAITAGPGVTDGVTGVANAWRANSPILVIGGQGPFANLRRGSLQEMDHVSVMRPITKWADACYQTHRIAEYVELAHPPRGVGHPGPGVPRDPDGRVHGPVRVASRRCVPTIRTAPPRLSPDRADVRERARAARQRASARC